MRCDLHVHSRYSGAVNLPLLRHVGRECYSEPAEIDRTARSRGMDLVTISDHDTIEGVLRIAALPHVFVSEEVTCGLPEGRVVHLGVFDLQERQHQAIAARRDDAEALFAYLAEQQLPFCVNHLYSPLTGRRAVADFHFVLERAAALETLNGMMPKSTNGFAAAAAAEHGLHGVAGSDAHALGSVARAYTEVPRARTKQEFLLGLRRGLTLSVGRSGSYARLTADITSVFTGALAENGARSLASGRDALRSLAMLALLPALGLVPLIALYNFGREIVQARAYYAAYRSNPRARRIAAAAASC
jgi:predicted metal-dependent phosphoesterase TrpH